MRPVKRIVGYVTYWAGLPLLYLYLRRGERARLLLRCGDQVLVLRGWLGAGDWMLPGGGIHTGERPEAAVLRELFEETGIVLQADQLAYLGKHQGREDNGITYTYHMYVSEVDEQPSLRLQANEISDGQWVPRRTLLASYRLTRTTRYILETWFKP